VTPLQLLIPNTSKLMIILVRNLDRATTRAELHGMFAKIGEVKACDLVIDEKTGQPKGLGLVDMPIAKQAMLAIRSLNGLPLRNMKLLVKKAAASALRDIPLTE
jgi:RNA recognition motif-containing protein